MILPLPTQCSNIAVNEFGYEVEHFQDDVYVILSNWFMYFYN